VAGEELCDLLERRPPVGLDELVHIASRDLDVFRARNVVSDVLAHRRLDYRVVGVVDDEGGHADRGKQRPRVHFGHERHHVRNSRGARRQAFHPSPRCPDLLVPGHVQIQKMVELPRPPHGYHGSTGFLGVHRVGAFSKRFRIALEYHECGGARGICCREHRARRDRAVDRDNDRFAAPEIVKHRGDAVGPLLQRRQRTRRNGIGGSGALLVEEDDSTERRHRLDPPLKGRQLRKKVAAGEPARDAHDVTRTFARRAIGDAQVPVHRVARLAEHCGSLSRGSGRVPVSCTELQQSVLRVFGVTIVHDAFRPRSVGRSTLARP
jgi:hypothetical protein